MRPTLPCRLYRRRRGRRFPRKSAAGEDLAKALGDLALRERWQLQELHTEEGRLDEVFRNITLPETAARKS